MVYVDSNIVEFDTARASLTAPLALSLAENAFKAGRIQTAHRYVEIAYAIFDAQFGMTAADANALLKGG